MHIGEIIAVAHSKGGAGKTSLTFNLAHALAAAGARVLVVDLETQMGQGAFLGHATELDPDLDAGAALMGWCDPDKTVRTDVYPNLDVMPANELSVNEAWGQLLSVNGRARLSALFDHARHHWDVTLIDMPGHQSLNLGAVLAASDGVLVPMPPEAGPVTELPTILNAIADSTAQDGLPEVSGIIKTRVWGNGIYRRFADQQIRTTADQFGAPAFRNKVPEGAKSGEAHLVGMPVGAYHPRARSAVAYRYIANKLIERRSWPFEIPRWT